MSAQTEKDHWSHDTYSAAASFVPKLAEKVLQYLDPQPRDRVLDVGCGDGVFTSRFASTVSEVLGVDASPSFIQSAQKDHGSSTVRFQQVDCRHLDREQEIMQGQWDKVISNAAFHWILRDPKTRIGALQACYTALRPGGTLVFEMGGAGNCAEVHGVLISALVHHGRSLEQARDAIPWFFPSAKWMRNTLKDLGFEVVLVESEYRPTELTTAGSSKTGLEGWIRLFGASMLETLDTEEKRNSAVKEACEALKSAVAWEEDGREHLGYVRLRAVARRPS